MFAFELQSRILNGESLSFPANCVIVLHLAPEECFGGTEEAISFLLEECRHRILANANTARFGYLHNPKYERITTSHRFHKDNFQARVDGNEIAIEFKSLELSEFWHTIEAVVRILPSILSVHLPFAVWPTRISGHIGESPVRYEFSDFSDFARVVSRGSIACSIRESLDTIELLENSKYRRLIASLHYFQHAVRLLHAGAFKFEFMAESILNFSKSLESLFSANRDQVREFLIANEFGEVEIEEKFIPVLLLRNEYDVGHASLGIHDHKDVQTLYEYLHFTEHDFRELLLKLITRGKQNRLHLPAYSVVESSAQEKLRKILPSMRSRIARGVDDCEGNYLCRRFEIS